MSDAAAAKSRAAGKLMQRAAYASVSVSTLLVLIKGFAYLATLSVAMLASLADSGLDLFTSLLNLFAIRHALQPADAEHRFGHGKAEPLAGLAQGAFIAGSAIFVIVAAINRLLAPQPVTNEVTGLVVTGIAIVATIGLVWFQRLVVGKTGSVAVNADNMHYVGDLASNIGVIVSLLLTSKLGWLRADPVIGLLIAAILAWSAWRVFRQSYDQLMDRELHDDERANIKAIVMRHAEVRNLHDLRTRAAGINTFIQFHIELDPAISLMRAHEVSDAVEADVCAAYPHAQVIIHQDPAGVEMPPALATS